MLVTSFMRHLNGQYTLEEVRDYFREHLNREFPASFVFGTEMSAEAVMLKWCCGNGHDVVQSTNIGLSGIVYYGNGHFTIRFIDINGSIWFNDGLIQARGAHREGMTETMGGIEGIRTV
ncbi:hypothetical protein EDD85DRAFT_795078 [Armillaria nabsnona]|nr:hypothetical protein EDD85DRAFT_795078 [Armillaria nabsnona]